MLSLLESLYKGHEKEMKLQIPHANSEMLYENRGFFAVLRIEVADFYMNNPENTFASTLSTSTAFLNSCSSRYAMLLMSSKMRSNRFFASMNEKLTMEPYEGKWFNTLYLNNM